MRQRVQAAAVVLFVLVVAGVVYILLTRVDRGAPPAGPSAGTAGDTATVDEGPVGRVAFTAGEGDLVVRFTAGRCDREGGARLELSRNRGRSFHRLLAPQVDDGGGVSATSPTVRAIVFAEATSPMAMTVGAADETCAVHRYTTTDRGVSWTQEPGELGEWYVDPETGDVVSPRDHAEAVCEEVASLTPVTKATATVFCTDGSIRRTSDRGSTWVDVGTLAGTSAALFTGARTGYAVVEGPKCRSRVYSTTDGGLTWTPKGCVTAGSVTAALSGTDQRLVAGGADGALLSTDGGATWKASTMK